jgi:hypothetical protein
MSKQNYHTVIVNQFFGIGDVIWSQTLVRYLANGKRIIWGVLPRYVDGLSRAYPDITFVDHRLLNIDYDRKEDHIDRGSRILPIRWADVMLNKPYNMCMRAKYDLYEMPWEQWVNRAKWQRNIFHEQEFFKRFDIEGDFNFVNNFAGSESQLLGSIQLDNGLPTIEMREIEQYSLFDWAHILEQATHIHTVSTSIIYVLEMLHLKAKEIHYYLKPNEADFSSTDYIVKNSRHNYILHERA